jgi:chemotaxis signal transduction protein
MPIAADVMDDASLNTHAIIIFSVGEDKFSVPCAAVKSVDRVREREQGAIDLRQAFGHSESSLGMDGRTLVLRHEGQQIKVVVDRLIAFDEMDEQTDLKRSGYSVAKMTSIERALVRGIIQGQVKVLDIAELFKRADRMLPRRPRKSA